MIYREWAPSGASCSIVERYWAVEPGPPAMDFPTFCFSDPLPGLAITTRGRWYSARRAAPPVCLFGAVTQSCRVTYSEDARVLGISLWPWGLVRLFGAQTQLSDRRIDLADVLPSEAALLLMLAQAADSTAAAAGACTEYLMSRQPARSVSYTAAAVRALLEPAARIESVARRLGITRQHLRRIVLAETGLTPKLLARLSRFRAAFDHSMQEDNGPNWPDTAAAFGYSDQSHLIAEFRRFAGRPPSELPRW